MRFRTAVLLAWLATLVAVLAQAIHGWETLPLRVASHFDFSGRPNGWMPRNRFLVMWLGVTLLCNLSVALPPLALRAIPDLVSLPNRRYWLSTPERRVRAGRVLMATVAACMALTNLGLFLAFSVVEDHAHTGRPIPFPTAAVSGLLVGIVSLAVAYPMWALRRPSKI